jgi:hypothetical protein
MASSTARPCRAACRRCRRPRMRWRASRVWPGHVLGATHVDSDRGNTLKPFPGPQKPRAPLDVIHDGHDHMLVPDLGHDRHQLHAGVLLPAALRAHGVARGLGLDRRAARTRVSVRAHPPPGVLREQDTHQSQNTLQPPPRPTHLTGKTLFDPKLEGMGALASGSSLATCSSSQ